MLYNLHFFSSKCRLFHKATLFGFCITHILNTGCAKIWKKFRRQKVNCPSQWPRCLRRRSAAARLLRSCIRIPPGAWMSVCCEFCVLSGRSLCEVLITRPDYSYRLCCVVVCDLETSWMRRPWPTGGRGRGDLRQKQINKVLSAWMYTTCKSSWKMCVLLRDTPVFGEIKASEGRTHCKSRQPRPRGRAGWLVKAKILTWGHWL